MATPLNEIEKAICGADAKRHPITGMVLEQGSGALSPDEQARRVHLPEIARTQGQAAAQAMLARLDAAKVAVPPTAGTEYNDAPTKADRRAAAEAAYEAKLAAAKAEFDAAHLR